MNSFARKIISLACVGMLSLTCVAQTTGGFDLSSQRREKQRLNPVPGHKVTGREFVVNPTPQSIVRTPGAGVLDVSAGFNISGLPKDFARIDFLTLNPRGVRVKVKSGKGVGAKQAQLNAAAGAYILDVTPKGVEIAARDPRGVFYALQTLRQLAATSSGGRIPLLTINDYPSLPQRGLVEGFYGTPWSHEVRKSLIRFLGQNKLNTFIFAPKDDPYHSSPNWRKPYPADQAAKIRELARVARDNQVDFVWAIHPGKDIRWNREDYDSLVNKFNMMHDLGVRSFFIFFDDIEGEGTNPNKQVELLNRLNRDFIKKKGSATKLTMCPTDYSRSWANPTERGSLAIFGRTLDKDIDVMYTGDAVCSDLTAGTMKFFNNLVKRPGYYWWNFPVSDYCRNYLLMGPAYGLDTTLTSNDVTAIVSNPMEHGEASKPALYGVADYAWNIPAYNPIDAWERALAEVMPGATEAFRTFAIHNCDTETGYRRDESWETETFMFDNFTPAQFEALQKEFTRIAATRGEMEKGCTDSLLLRELRPWLVEFEKLGQRGLRTLELIRIFPTASPAEFWAAYKKNIMTPEEEAAYAAHKVGTLKLQPFYLENMEGMLEAFYKRLTGDVPPVYRPIGSMRNIQSSLSKAMLDGKDDTYYHSGNGQRAGDWLGLDLRKVRPVTEVRILQGRNSKDDVDYYDHAVLEVSKDGKEWTPLTAPLEKQYEISWSGPAVEARYVRLRRLDSPRTNWIAVRTFSVTAGPLPDIYQALDSLAN